MDPFAISDVDSKVIAGKYVLKNQEDPVEKWKHLSRQERLKLLNEQTSTVKMYGKIRVDSENSPQFHGQFDPNNQKLKHDVRELEQQITVKLVNASDDLEQLDKDDTEVKYPKNPDKIQAEPAPSYEERFPINNKKTIQALKLGDFTFHMTGFWNRILSTTEREVPAVTVQFLKGRTHLLKKKEQTNKPDLPEGTLVEAAKHAKEEPIKAIEPVLQELDGEEVENALVEKTSEEKIEELQEEKDEFDEVVTAYDYVSKFKEGKIKPTCDHGQKVLELTKPQSALDSQGFNSFIGYAPDLSKFHREQLITLLTQSVLFADNGILIINKPYGLVSQGNTENEDKKQFAYNLPDLLPAFAHELVRQGILKECEKELRICHRLDRETTGTLVLATNSSKAAEIQQLFAENKVLKEYITITRGVPDPEKGIIDIPIEVGTISGRERMVLRPTLREELRRLASPSRMAKRAVTSYSIIDWHGSAALIKVEPQTGAKHQIRVHLGFAMRCPILGDHKYSYLDRLAPQKLPSDMLMSLNVRPSKVRNIPLHLHATSIFLPNAGRNKACVITRAPLPGFFTKTMKMLKLVKK